MPFDTRRAINWMSAPPPWMGAASRSLLTALTRPRMSTATIRVLHFRALLSSLMHFRFVGNLLKHILWRLTIHQSQSRPPHLFYQLRKSADYYLNVWFSLPPWHLTIYPTSVFCTSSTVALSKVFIAVDGLCSSGMTASISGEYG